MGAVGRLWGAIAVTAAFMLAVALFAADQMSAPVASARTQLEE
jgi:hypothetical protein